MTERGIGMKPHISGITLGVEDVERAKRFYGGGMGWPVAMDTQGYVAFSVNGLTLAGAADWVDPVFTGTALTVAVTLSTVLGRRRGAQRII